MDVERTIQFLIANAAQHDARLAALESGMLGLNSVVQTLAQNTLTLTGSVETLIGQIDRMSDRMTGVMETIQERDAQGRERDDGLAQRIEQLARAIAASRNGNSHPEG